jgi:hypothetical protein
MDPGGPNTYGSGTLIEVKFFQNYTGRIRNPLRKNYSRFGTTTLLTRAMSKALQANCTVPTLLCNVKTCKNLVNSLRNCGSWRYPVLRRMKGCGEDGMPVQRGHCQPLSLPLLHLSQSFPTPTSYSAVKTCSQPQLLL